MGNKDKQQFENSKQLKALIDLANFFPPSFRAYRKVADRLNDKGLSTQYGKKYSYQTVWQSANGRWYDQNIHEEFAILRLEYLDKEKRIQDLENQLVA